MGHLTPDTAAQIIERHVASGAPRPRAFVETGTHVGTTLYPIYRARMFDRIHSIELSRAHYERALAHLYGLSDYGVGVELHFGDSAELVPDLALRLDEPVFWWLDAHWYDAPDVADGSPCPLFDELLAIGSRVHPDVVVIDDAQCFGRRWGEQPGGDWTAIHPTSILAALGSRATLHYENTWSQFVVHMR